MSWMARVGGHPVHPMLVHFPIALWTGAVVADAGGWLVGGASWWLVSTGCQALGVVAATLAMVFGFIDYASLGREHPAQNTASAHMLAMSTAWLLFLVSVALRAGHPATAPSIWTSALTLLAFVVMIFGAWYGGQLVYRFGVGVSARASAAAPGGGEGPCVALRAAFRGARGR